MEKLRHLGDLSGQLGVAIDQLAYLMLYAPEFPAEDSTDLGREFARLASSLVALRASASESWRVALVDLAIRETEEAHHAFGSAHDTLRARGLLEHAESHLREAAAAEPRRAVFLVGQDGSVLAPPGGGLEPA